jgi:hypothetical protein
MESRVCLRPQEVEETVTNYRLERRTDLRTVEDHVLVCESVLEKVTDWRLETRVGWETVTCHVLRPEVVEETVTNYRRECRTDVRTVMDYLPEWREETVTCWHLEVRSGVRAIEKVIPCPAEVVVPVTEVLPVPAALRRKRWIAEPLGPVNAATPFCITASGEGFTASCGPPSAVGRQIR